MRLLKRFARNHAGSATQHFGALAIVIGLGSLALASMLDHATRKDGNSAIAFLLPEDPSHINHGVQGGTRTADAGNLDMTPVGSLQRPIILDPCTGKEK